MRFEKTAFSDFPAFWLYYGGFSFRPLFGCLFFSKRESGSNLCYFGLYFMVFTAFQNVSLKTFLVFQSVCFLLLTGGIWYFKLPFSSFILGFVLSQMFAFTSLWLGERLFGKKISLVTLGFMVFKWGVFAFVLYFVLQKVNQMAFLIGIFGMVSFQIAFAAANKQKN